MKKAFLVVLMLTVSKVASAGFITGAVVGAIVGSSISSNKEGGGAPQPAIVYSDNANDIITCLKSRVEDACDAEGANTPGKYVCGNSNSNWCLSVRDSVAASGYKTLVKRGVSFVGDKTYIIMEVSR